MIYISEQLFRLISFTLTLTEEERVLQEAFASRHETDILHVVALGLALHSRGKLFLAKTCGEEAFRRFRGLSQFSSKYSSSAGSDEFMFLVSAFAQLDAIGATTEDLVWLIDKNSPPVWLARIQMLVNEGNLDDLITVAASLTNGQKKSIISDACIRAAAKAGVNIAEHDDFNVLTRTPLVAAIEVALTRTSTPLNEPIPVNWLKGDYDEHKEDLATLVHHWFFSAVHLSLCMAVESQNEFEFIRAPTYEDRENITDFLNALSGIGAQIAHSWWCGEFVNFHELFALLEQVDFRRFRQSYNKSSAAEDFRAALHRIACDVSLGSALLKNMDDVALQSKTMEATLQYTWFDSASFRTQYATGALTRMTTEAAVIFIHSQRSLLDTAIQQETSVHLQTPLQLCAMAITHNLTSEARELCTQTWELTTGYVHRKDPTLNNTVDAIAYLVDVAAEDARRLLGQIAPQIHNVLNYTDGSGTRYVLADADRLLAKLSPSALVIKYEEHIDAGDWSLAENSLQAYVKQGISEGWSLDSLMRTGLHPEIFELLQQLAQDGSASAAERLGVLEEHNGWDLGYLQRQVYSGGSDHSKPYEGDVTTYEPEQLSDLLEGLSSYYSEHQRLLRVWYQYWESQKQSKRLLTELDKVLFSENRWMRDVLPLCDLAFQTKRRRSGLSAAWKYLVYAQIRSGGWFGNMEKEATSRSRLGLVAQYYPQRCDDFVTETTYTMFDDPVPSRIVPLEAMVYFYIKQNRLEEAVKFAETMVNCVIEDTRTLPLNAPRWMAELVSPPVSEAR